MIIIRIIRLTVVINGNNDDDNTGYDNYNHSNKNDNKSN